MREAERGISVAELASNSLTETREADKHACEEAPRAEIPATWAL